MKIKIVFANPLSVIYQLTNLNKMINKKDNNIKTLSNNPCQKKNIVETITNINNSNISSNILLIFSNIQVILHILTSNILANTITNNNNFIIIMILGTDKEDHSNLILSRTDKTQNSMMMGINSMKVLNSIINKEDNYNTHHICKIISNRGINILLICNNNNNKDILDFNNNPELIPQWF